MGRRRGKGLLAGAALANALGAPQRAKPQGRSAIPGIKDGSGGGGGRGQGPALPVLVQSPLITADTVYFAPPDHEVEIGKSFTTPIVFYNSSDRKIDRFELWLRYDPELLEPAWVNAEPIQGRLNEPIQSEIWRDRGVIRLRGAFSDPMQGITNPLLAVSWKARETASVTEVKFEAPDGESIGFYEGDENVLEGSDVGNNGLVSASVKLIDRATDPERIQLVEQGRDPLQPIKRRRAGVHLALVPYQDQVAPDEVSTIDVVLINPEVAELDELRFQIRFDPQAVEILDADDGNYDSTGINIFDGDFHDGMPFEAHWDNTADSDAGRITYAVGSGRGPRPYASGTIARIVFKMKRDAGQTDFWFEGLDPLTGRYLSDVRAAGQSILGPAEDGRGIEALHNTRISVAPQVSGGSSSDVTPRVPVGE